MVARFAHTEEVTGSKPVSPTPLTLSDSFLIADAASVCASCLRTDTRTRSGERFGSGYQPVAGEAICWPSVGASIECRPPVRGSIVTISSVQGRCSVPGTRLGHHQSGHRRRLEDLGQQRSAGRHLQPVQRGEVRRAVRARASPQILCKPIKRGSLAPIGRLAHANESAACVAWLLNNESDFVTGRSLGRRRRGRRSDQLGRHSRSELS